MTDVERLARFVGVDLFVDHSRIVQLECLRAGIWGTDDTWGRMLSYQKERC
jgi:phosphosulfolactate synthase (CoM biosynthesis protein A)